MSSGASSLPQGDVHDNKPKQAESCVVDGEKHITSDKTQTLVDAVVHITTPSEIDGETGSYSTGIFVQLPPVENCRCILTCEHNLVNDRSFIQFLYQDNCDSLKIQLKSCEVLLKSDKNGSDFKLLKLTKEVLDVIEKHKIEPIDLLTPKVEPKEHDAVTVIQHPQGKKKVESTQRIIELDGPYFRCDGAPKPGSSGGAVVFGGELVGLHQEINRTNVGVFLSEIVDDIDDMTEPCPMNGINGEEVVRCRGTRCYIGGMKEYEASGEGKYACENCGSYWEGQYQKGKMNGSGVFAGRGKYQGDKFEGIWKDGMLCAGKFTWSDGTSYEGVWKLNEPHGRGKFTWPNGSVYEGEYQDGNLHGVGKFTVASGKVYEGEYKDGKEHGTGKCTWASGKVHEGSYKDGRKHGIGKCTHSDGRVYEGEYKDGKQHGSGTSTGPDGSSYGGNFKDGKVEGVGKCVFPDGSVYEGDWKDCMSHGHGRKTLENGDWMEGAWVEGGPDGEFQCCINGVMSTQVWRKGRKVRSWKLFMKKVFR